MAKDFASILEDVLQLEAVEQQALMAVLKVNSNGTTRRKSPRAAASAEATQRRPRGEVQDMVINALSKTPCKPSDIVSKTGLKSQQVNNVLQKLKAEKKAKWSKKDGWSKA